MTTSGGSRPPPGTGRPGGETTTSVTTATGENITIRPLEAPGDLAGVLAFEQSEPGRYVCMGGRGREQETACGVCGRPLEPGRGLSFGAFGTHGVVASAAIDACAEDSATGVLAVTVRPDYLEHGVLPPLLRLIAGSARSAGYRRLLSCVHQQPHAFVPDIRQAGIAVEARLDLGGVSEVVLSL